MRKVMTETLEDMARRLVDGGVRAIANNELFGLYHEEGLAAFCAYFAKEFGLDALRDELTAWKKNKFELTVVEPLVDAARELDVRGLKHVGDVLRELAEDLPSAIDQNPWLEGGECGDNPRQARIWDAKFLRRRQRQTGVHMRELVAFYREYVPDIADLSNEGTVHSDMRKKLDRQSAMMEAERGRE